MTRVKRDWRPNFRERRSSVVWCVVGGCYTLISVVLIHQCLLGLLVSAPSLVCEGRGFEPPLGRGNITMGHDVCVLIFVISTSVQRMLRSRFPIRNNYLLELELEDQNFFGTMDLTQGYHQTPLEMATRAYTSFITYSGVYQFTLLPFGLKRAPSYSQEVMSTIVLAGLIFVICEMYIDDCIVFGSDMNEFIDRLRQVFMRFRQHHLFVKASKCHFGYTEIEYGDFGRRT
jgi:Reverse transcriptase (RNA-dependent DNA polymerase)